MKLFKLFESRELNSEFLWFQRYITNHNLETQMEIEGDKIVFLVGKKLVEWDVREARRIRTEVITDAKQSYDYAFANGRFELGEPAISKTANYSYGYARNVIKGRFELGEPAIAGAGLFSFLYAKEAIHGQFKLGEPAISKDAHYSYEYATDAINGRFELGEPAIKANPAMWAIYVKKFQILK